MAAQAPFGRIKLGCLWEEAGKQLPNDIETICEA
jgi:hypothetical protein